MSAQPFFMQEFIDLTDSKLDEIVDQAPRVVGEDPSHPRGCPRKAWIAQANFWKGVVESWVPGAEIHNKAHAEMMFIRLFVVSFEGLRRRMEDKSPKKFVVACPIRGTEGEENKIALKYIEGLRLRGHEVFSYWDTLQESCPTGSDILEKHLEAVRDCDEMHVFWKETSRGTHWEVGTAVALNKKIVIVGLEGPMPTGQSYLLALCQRREVEWRVDGKPRPAIQSSS